MNMRFVFVVLVLLAGCAGQDSSIAPDETPIEPIGPGDHAADVPDVDAEYEALFESGNLRLKTIDKSGSESSVRSMTPFMRSTDLRRAQSERVSPLLMDDPTIADTMGDELGVEFHVFAIGQADSMLA